MNEELDDLYSELIMEHSMNSYNKKELDNASFCELGHNPNCGDEISLEIKLDGDKIEDMAFTGHGCAISQASTSIMIDTLKGKTLEEAEDLIEKFIRMIDKNDLNKDELRSLEDAVAFQNISHMPARVKCALLAWHTLDKMIKENNLK
jgi:nitrogen fixation NifU-like protein